ALAFAAREFKRALKVEALRRHGRQLIACDRIDERGFDALPALPPAGQIALERLWRRGHGSLPRTRLSAFIPSSAHAQARACCAFDRNPPCSPSIPKPARSLANKDCSRGCGHRSRLGADT